MNKAQLIDALIAGHHGKREMCVISKVDMEAIVEALGEIVRDRLAAGSDVVLPGIGKLYTVAYKAGTVRDPVSCDDLRLPLRRSPEFWPAQELWRAM